jgi:putative hydrolase of the HAD superfamily
MELRPRSTSRQRTLLVDADDTLWENNIYFERVTTEFVKLMTARGLDAHAVEQSLIRTEQQNVHITGYGSQAFCASLHEVARAWNVPDLEPWIAEQESWMFHHPIELMPGVLETMPRLFVNNRLIMVTKGLAAEQLAKLERSGLAGFFHESEVVFEKNAAAYSAIIDRHDLDRSTTWMIGNSPRSDINPAKSAGLGTVFIPYHTTWWHELEEIAATGRDTLMLTHFGELTDHFG